MSERLAGAEFPLLVVEPVVALLVEPGVVPMVPVPMVPVPVVPVPVVPVPLERAVADDEREDDEGDGLGHTLLYTNCSGAPLQVVADPALKVPFGYIQQVPEAYGELLGLCGLKTT